MTILTAPTAYAAKLLAYFVNAEEAELAFDNAVINGDFPGVSFDSDYANAVRKALKVEYVDCEDTEYGDEEDEAVESFLANQAVPIEDLEGLVLVERVEHDQSERVVTVTKQLIKDIASLNGHFTPAQVVAFLVNGDRIYTNFRSYQVAKPDPKPSQDETVDQARKALQGREVLIGGTQVRDAYDHFPFVLLEVLGAGLGEATAGEAWAVADNLLKGRTILGKVYSYRLVEDKAPQEPVEAPSGTDRPIQVNLSREEYDQLLTALSARAATLKARKGNANTLDWAGHWGDRLGVVQGLIDRLVVGD